MGNVPKHPTVRRACESRNTPQVLLRERLEKKQLELREAALAAVILASGVWMIIAGVTKLCGE